LILDINLEGKVILITGASQGLGLELAKGFFNCGASLALCSRTKEPVSIINDFKKSLKGDQKVVYAKTDVSDEKDVKNFVNLVLTKFKRIDVLINNAGIYGPKGEIEKVNWKQWVKSIEINLFGSILMSKAVIPFFKEQLSGKIIQLSGGGATAPMPFISSYAVSKAAIVRFVETVALELTDYNIDVNAIAPGALNTRLLDEILEAGPEKVGQDFYLKSIEQKKNGGSCFSPAVDLALFLASEKSNGISGKLISAIWDDWESWTEHIQELKEKDIYTLRRITSRDRNLNWGDK